MNNRENTDKEAFNVMLMRLNVIYELGTNDVIELEKFIDHFILQHDIKTANINVLMREFKVIQGKPTNNSQSCDYMTLNNKHRCMLSVNWGKTNKWNETENETVWSRFSQSSDAFNLMISYFVAGFDEKQEGLIIPDAENSKHVVLFNTNKKILKALVSSKLMKTKEVEQEKKNYDLIIHGISRILDPQTFLNALLKLALDGVNEIVIPDNKQSETRLFRDFDKEALGSLMLLTSLIRVRIGKKLIQSEHDVLQYSSTASKLTKESQMADIRKIQKEWIEEQFNNSDMTDNQVIGHFKGSFNKIMTRSILIERCKSNDEVIDFFRNNLQDSIAKVDNKVLAECVHTSITRAFDRMSKKLGVSSSIIQKFYVFDQEKLVLQFNDLMQSINITESKTCVICSERKISKDQLICLDCQRQIIADRETN